MEKYAILLGYLDKQYHYLQKMKTMLVDLDLSSFEGRCVFALHAQQFYTAIEDLLKQIAKCFENHIQDLSTYHKELLIRLNTEIPTIRPRFLSDESFVLLDKLRSFRHFIRHAYDCELDEKQIREIQHRLKLHYTAFEKDFSEFRNFVVKVSSA